VNFKKDFQFRFGESQDSGFDPREPNGRFLDVSKELKELEAMLEASQI